MMRLVSTRSKFPNYHLISRANQCSVNAQRSFVSATSASRPTVTNMPGREIDLLEIKDARFKLPGNVGFFVNDVWLNKLKKLDEPKPVPKSTVLTNAELLRNLQDDKPMPNADILLAEEKKDLICTAHDCPYLLIKDFQELFPHNKANIMSGLTVMTLTQRTENDMSCWSREVDIEREKLMERYVSIADKMCTFLKESGYWADFIDPSSGRPFHSEYTPATFFETDERYRNFGFEIEDLGCCKVISHIKYGTNSFVGALFTNAPAACTAIESLLCYMDE